VTETPGVRELWVTRLGRMGYAEALKLQRQVARDRISGAIPQDVLLLVEHPPVVTLGRSTKQKNMISSPKFMASRGVELFEVERGGDVTFQGPPQLHGYHCSEL
jgi:lipoyl(octanoyl) transferase